jgi:tyrosyl-tRNA synthetase
VVALRSHRLAPPLSIPSPDQVRDALAGCELLPDELALCELFARGAPRVLWGLSPVAPLHLGYDELLVRLRRLAGLGAEVTLLLADYHAMMTHGLSGAEVGGRALYAEKFIRQVCGLDAEVVRGSGFQTRVDYVEPLYALMNELPLRDITDHLPGAIRGKLKDGSLRLGACVYVVMQCLDATWLGVDAVFGEAGQKKIYALLEGTLAGAPPAIYAPTGIDVQGRPLRESSAATRISIHETRAGLGDKVRKMYAPPPGQPLEPGRRHALLETFQHSVFPWRDQPVPVRDEAGAWRELGSHDELAADYAAGTLHPRELKRALVDCLWQRLAPAQEAMAPYAGWIDPTRL